MSRCDVIACNTRPNGECSLTGLRTYEFGADKCWADTCNRDGDRRLGLCKLHEEEIIP